MMPLKGELHKRIGAHTSSHTGILFICTQKKKVDIKKCIYILYPIFVS